MLRDREAGHESFRVMCEADAVCRPTVSVDLSLPEVTNADLSVARNDFVVDGALR